MSIRYAKMSDFGDLCAKLACLVDELQLQNGGAGHSRAPGSLQITSHGGITLSAGQKRELLAQLTVVPGPNHIPLEKGTVLAKMVVLDIAYYHPGTNGISFIASAANTTPYPELAQDDISSPTSS